MYTASSSNWNYCVYKREVYIVFRDSAIMSTSLNQENYFLFLFCISFLQIPTNFFKFFVLPPVLANFFWFYIAGSENESNQQKRFQKDRSL